MVHTPQFAILQNDAAGPTPEQLKRVFKVFTHLTDADAVRLAVGAHGILMRQIGRDAARALKQAFQSEGVNVAVIAERDLPELPEAQKLNHLELWPQAFTVYDLQGRRTSIDWHDIALVAAGAAPHYEIGRTQIKRAASVFAGGSEAWHKAVPEATHQNEHEPQYFLEILLERNAARYQLDATQFTFRYVIDRPGLSLEEKFIWLVREICRQSSRASLNNGALRLRDGDERVPFYMSRQSITDEMLWMLWQKARDAH